MYVGDMVAALGRVRLEGISDVADSSDRRAVKLLTLLLNLGYFHYTETRGTRGLINRCKGWKPLSGKRPSSSSNAPCIAALVVSLPVRCAGLLCGAQRRPKKTQRDSGQSEAMYLQESWLSVGCGLSFWADLLLQLGSGTTRASQIVPLTPPSPIACSLQLRCSDWQLELVTHPKTPFVRPSRPACRPNFTVRRHHSLAQFCF